MLKRIEVRGKTANASEVDKEKYRGAVKTPLLVITNEQSGAKWGRIMAPSHFGTPRQVTDKSL